MRFNSTSSYTSSKALTWDPNAVLELTNHAAYGITCIGHAPSKGRRCRNRVAQHKVASALSILRTFGSAPKAAASLAELRPAAELLLCWLHGNQASKMLSKWGYLLEDCISDQSDEIPSSIGLRVKKEDTEGGSAKKWRACENERKEDGARRRTSESYEHKWEQEQKERQKWQKQQEERRRAEEKKREDKQRRREEQRREEQRREERRREEQRREEQRREEQKREEQRREKAAREEAFRERVRLAKEKRMREAREKLQKEAAEWRAAWERYSDGWTKGKTLTVADIPWPVRSGLQRDVNEASVKLFFEKAPPTELMSSGEKVFKLINAENKRWHTDKVMQRFGPDVVKGAAKPTLDLIAKVMIELRQETQKNRCATALVSCGRGTLRLLFL
ncbi:hypothetical protein GGR52DRAFT_229632 [Hypoxylon sp. FL1284]|nr:hypothetical protein GGR52DRAFT_229632 [Hypoxylon sp. FL1284]